LCWACTKAAQCLIGDRKQSYLSWNCIAVHDSWGSFVTVKISANFSSWNFRAGLKLEDIWEATSCSTLLSSPQPSFSLSLFFFFLSFFETGSYYIAQGGLEFSMLLPWSLERWDYRCVLPHLVLPPPQAFLICCYCSSLNTSSDFWWSHRLCLVFMTHSFPLSLFVGSSSSCQC
jgi:hypothetical protein